MVKPFDNRFVRVEMMQGQTFNLQVSDGTAMLVYAAMPAGNGPFPALIVFQEAYGVNRQRDSPPR
jgi:dienelactone hydrolase